MSYQDLFKTKKVTLFNEEFPLIFENVQIQLDKFSEVEKFWIAVDSADAAGSTITNDLYLFSQEPHDYYGNWIVNEQCGEELIYIGTIGEEFDGNIVKSQMLKITREELIKLIEE